MINFYSHFAKRFVSNFLLVLTFGVFLGPIITVGQVSLTAIGTAYTQNFNTLPSTSSGTAVGWSDNSTIAGWYSNKTTYLKDDGGNNVGSLYDYGTNSNTDRALGAVTSGSAATVQFGVRLVNNTGSSIGSFTISFKGEQWRQTTNSQSLVFEYLVGATSLSTGTYVPNTSLNFTSPKTGTAGALDGNVTGNFSNVSTTLTVNVNNGQEIWLRWTKTGSTSPGLAVDDVNITPNPPTSSLSDFFRTKQSGNWNNTSTWESSSDGSAWISATLTPADASNAIAIQNGHTVTVAANVSIDQTIVNPTGALVVSNGITLTVLNNGLTLQSTSAGTAQVGNSTGGTITGNLTVERYIGTAKRAYRLLTAPVSGQTINAAWQEGQTNNTNTVAGYGTLITGGSTYADATAAATNGFDYINSAGSSSIRVYTPGSTGGSWAAGVTNTKTTNIESQPAYMLFVRGDRSVTSGAGTATLRATGAYKTGAAVTVSAANSHTLVGNPYPSSIDFDAVYTSNSSAIKRRFWIWDATTGTFGSYKLINYNGSAYEAIPAPFTPGTGSATDLTTIQSGQGFFVEPNSGGTLNITEAHKTSATVTTPIFRTGNGTSEKLWINLNQVNADNTITLADGVQARYDNSYTTADNIGKATNFNENLAIARGGSNLIVQSRQLIDNSDTVFLKLWNTTARNYQFQLKADNFSNAPLTAYLEDKYLKTSTPVSLDGGISNVNFAVTSDAASADADRFMVVFKSLGVLPVSFTTVKAYEKERNIQVEWKVATETNTKAYEVEKSTNGRDFAKAGTIAATASGSYSWLDITPAAGNNFYRIKVIDNGGEAKYSSIVRVNITKGTKGIGVYPNPITGNQFILELKNKLAGKYTVKLYNTAGQTLFTTTITHAGGSSTEAMSLPALSEGVYQLEVTDEGGAKDIIKLLKK